MRLLVLSNQDFPSYFALRQLLPLLPMHTVHVFQTAQVGASRPKPPALMALARHEQRLLQDQLGVARSADWPIMQQAMSQQLAVPVTPVSDVNQGRGYELLRAFQSDLMVSIRFGSILKAPAITVPSLGVINLHSGLLPDYRGVMATFWSLLHQRPDYGYTIHRIVDEGVDTGPMIVREARPLALNSDYFSQLLTLYRLAVPRLAVVIDRITKGKSATILPLESSSGGYYSTPNHSDIAQFTELGLRLF